MAGNHVFTDWVAPSCVRFLKNSWQVCQFFSRANERDYQQEFPVGDTVRIKYPQRYTVNDGFGWDPQGIDRRYTTVVADQMMSIQFDWDSVEKALQMERSQEDIEENIINPAMMTLAQEMDSRAARFAYLNCPNVSGTLASAPTSLVSYHGARTRMLEHGGWVGKKRAGLIISPYMSETVLTTASTGVLNLFNPNKDVSDAFREGYLGGYAGFKWFESMSLPIHTTGVLASQTGVTTNSAGQTGSTLTFTCTAGDSLKAGDIFTLTGVNAVNPLTRQSTARLRQFKVMADTTAASTTLTVTIFPAIVASGQYKNVDAAPASGATLTLMPGTSMSSATARTGTFGLALTNEAFAMVGIDLPMPKAGTKEVIEKYTDPDSNVSIGIIRDFDTKTRSWINRLDAWIGFGQLYGDASACLIASSA